MREERPRRVAVVRGTLRAMFSIRFAPVLGYMVTLGVTYGGDHEMKMRFFELAAQVIPVLLLVLAIEIRAFEPPRGLSISPPRSGDELFKRIENPRTADAQAWAMTTFLILGGMVAGEAASLIVVAYKLDANIFIQGVVLGSIVGGLLMIALAALAPRSSDDT